MKMDDFLKFIWLKPAEELRCGATSLKNHAERKISYPWELIVNLRADLESDLRVLGAGILGLVHPSAVLYAPENMLIEAGAEVEAGAVLDARGGPIYIGKNTIVRPQSYLRGPLSIGPECRIGGEVTHSIFHGYTNKAHYGFIGHSYIGEWVNLGAGTTNSNLKNTYGTVKMTLNGKELDTGEQFLGCLIGDHAKVGIGTLIPTGAVIGLGANIFGGGLTPKAVPAFSWGAKEKVELEKFIATGKNAMSRRGQKMSAGEETLLKKLFNLSSG